MIVHGPEIAGWVLEPHGGSSRGNAIGWEVEGKLKAGFVVDEWNGINCFVHIRLEGNVPRSFWFAMVDWVYNQMECKRMTAPVASSNDKCLKLLEHIGWNVEGRLPESAYDKSDLVFLTWKKEDCYMLDWGRK